MHRAALALGDFIHRLHPRERWLRAEERRLRLALGEDWVQRRLALGEDWVQRRAA